MTVSTDSAAAAIKQWSDSLVDIGGRNRLLFYKPQRSGTIDFWPNDAVDEVRLSDLLEGGEVRLTELMPHDPNVMRRGRAIFMKSKEHEEEQGIRTLFLAKNLVSWDDEPGRRPASPMFLSALQIEQLGRLGDDFALRRSDDWELNPSLLNYLGTKFLLTIDEDALGNDFQQGDVHRTLDALMEIARDVPGLSADDRVVLGTFSYAKLPMVRDLEHAPADVAAHPLVMALTGDPEARQQLRGGGLVFGDGDSDIAADPPPQDEFLILDADGSQSRVINAALQGRNLVMVGPPGTGKSQTIANLIAALAARGKSALFVAEKRAAIDAVTKRLNSTGLGSLVLDLHEGVRSRRQTADQLAKALETAQRSVEPDTARLHHELNRSKAQLADANNALHRTRSPWGLSVFDIHNELLEYDAAELSDFRLRSTVLRELGEEERDEAADGIAEYIQLGGARLDTDPDAPWAGAHRGGRVASSEQSADIGDTLDDLATGGLRQLLEEIDAAADALRCSRPASLNAVEPWLDATARVAEMLQSVTHDAFTVERTLVELDLAPAERGAVGRLLAVLTNPAYRRAKSQAADLLRDRYASPSEARSTLLTVLDVAETWRNQAGAAPIPQSIPTLDHVRERLEDVTAGLEGLNAATAGEIPLSLLGWRQLQAVTDQLASADSRRILARLPRLHQLRQRFKQLGLIRLVRHAGDQQWTEVEARRRFHAIWLLSLLDEIRLTDSNVDAFNAVVQDAAAIRFAAADRDHIAVGARRVQRAWAEQVIDARNAFSEQEQIVLREAHKKRRHLSTRQLLREAPDLLLKLKPCWAMSPLVVPQILPREQLFDVVVFDEASQVLPADGVPALLRGRRAVVAGDSRQLPPTTFFTSTADDYEDEEDEDAELALDRPVTADMESILDAISTLIPGNSRTLSWHYRSRDERLIAFSNHHIYDGSLTTFPNALAEDCVRHVLVPFSERAITSKASNSAEVDVVVDLILEHAAKRPGESLGVIAFGINHAHRIEETLRLRRQSQPELDEFFSEAREEPFFVKNLERVQGDERDAIILSVGYGRGERGRLRYGFGPLNQEGGYRRLNVAVTRAKRRITAVSTFTTADMDPDALKTEGPKLLREYLAYCASGGKDLGSARRDAEPLNPFEIDVRAGLEQAGIPLQAQYGASGYRIDFAAMHPEQPGRPVLAIEADGKSYHSAINARERDRLRQEHLERLGWRFHRIWSTEWFRNREQEIERAVEAWRAAVAAVGRPDAAPPPAAQVQEPGEAPTTPPPVTTVRMPRPDIRPGLPIVEYEDAELDAMARWAQSDGLLHTDDQLIRLIAEAMGYRRLGHRIREHLSRAIERVRQSGGEQPDDQLRTPPPFRPPRR